MEISLGSGRDLTQRLLEDFHGLAALDQVLVVDDDRRHGLDAALAVEALALAHLVGIAIRFENLACMRRIEARPARRFRSALRDRSDRALR